MRLVRGKVAIHHCAGWFDQVLCATLFLAYFNVAKDQHIQKEVVYVGRKMLEEEGGYRYKTEGVVGHISVE
jgi:hypothetical protein